MSETETNIITNLTKEDKNILMKGYTLQYYKWFHYLFAGIICVTVAISYWKFNKDAVFESLSGFFTWLLLLFNLLFLIDFLFHKFKILNNKKIITTGLVTNKYESKSEHGGTIIVINNEKYDITWVNKIHEFETNDSIEMHFICSKKNEKRKLFRIEKL